MGVWGPKRRREGPTVGQELGDRALERAGCLVLPARIVFGVLRSIAYGVASLFTTFVGRVALFVAAALMLLDASWGSDGVGIPILGWLGWVALGVYGFVRYRRRRRWEEVVRDTVFHNVPGHYRSEPETVRFPPRIFGFANGGRWLGRWDFVFLIPSAMQPSQQGKVEQHLRSRLPAGEGASWAFGWDWAAHVASAELVADLPTAVKRFHASPNPELVPLGVSLSGEVLWPLDNNFGNLFVTGGPGGGKSVIVNNVVRHCLEHADGFELLAIDMKGGVELGYLERFPNVSGVAEDLDASLSLLRGVKAEVDRRQAMLRAEGAKKIDGLNEALRARGEPPLRRRVLLVDELAELTDVPEFSGRSSEAKEENRKKADCKALIDSVVRLGRASGVHVVVALQRPDARYMGGAMRSNIQARVVTGRIDQAGAQMVGSKIASELPAIPGRGVWWLGGQEEVVQYYLTEDEDLDRIASGGVRT